MFREFSSPNYHPNQPQQNPFKTAGMQSIDFYGNIGYPKPDYPVLMQQQYYDNYQYNKMFSSQVFTPHVQPIFIAGPIYKNSPVFQGPQYLSQSLFQPVQKNRFYNYNQPDEIIEDHNGLNLQSKQQLEENIKIRNEIINQWNFEEEQRQKESQQSSEYEYVQETQHKRPSYSDKEKHHKRKHQQNQQHQYQYQEEGKQLIEKKHSQKQSSHSLKSLDGEKQRQTQNLPSIQEEVEQPITIFNKKPEFQQTVSTKKPEQQQTKVNKKPEMQQSKSRKRGKRNLKILLKALTFILMYFLEMKRQILKRKKLQANKENGLEIVNQAMEEGADWILNFAENDLNQFWSKKESLNWLENDQLSDKEKTNRITKVKLFIQKISIILSDNMKESSFKPEFLSFLAQLTQNFQFPPDQYFFNFEVQRLEFNSFGAIKNIKNPQQKMVLAFFIMIRLLGFTILYAPWTLGVSNISKSSILESNSLIIVSVLQELVVGEFREIKILENNQNHLSNDLKINPRPQGPLKIIPDPKTTQEKTFLKTTLEPLIYPTYKREEMKDLFEKQIEWVDNTMSTFDQIYTQLVKMTNSWHKNNKVSITAGLKLKKKQRY